MDKQFKSRASIIDGSVEIDESLKPITNDDIGRLMRQEEKAMAEVMSEVTGNKADNTALDL